MNLIMQLWPKRFEDDNLCPTFRFVGHFRRMNKAVMGKLSFVGNVFK